MTGGLTQDTLVANPQPLTLEKLAGTSPAIDGTIEVGSARSYQIAGFVKTSKGRVATNRHGLPSLSTTARRTRTKARRRARSGMSQTTTAITTDHDDR